MILFHIGLWQLKRRELSWYAQLRNEEGIFLLKNIGTRQSLCVQVQ